VHVGLLLRRIESALLLLLLLLLVVELVLWWRLVDNEGRRGLDPRGKLRLDDRVDAVLDGGRRGRRHVRLLLLRGVQK
jgi:hypothetical protein